MSCGHVVGISNKRHARFQEDGVFFSGSRNGFDLSQWVKEQNRSSAGSQICRRALLGLGVQGMKGVKVARLNERVWGCVQKAEHVGGLHLVHVGRRFPFLFQIFGIEPQGNEWFGCQQESSPAQGTSERYIRLPLSVKPTQGIGRKNPNS